MTMAGKNKSGGRRGDQFNDVEEKPYRVGDGRSPTETVQARNFGQQEGAQLFRSDRTGP
jgi:hypothetical protein